MATPHATAVIDLGVLASNVSRIRAHVAGPEIMAVVKADAYGHGLVPCAKAAVAGGATWLATALLSEAIALRDAGLRVPVLAWLNTADDQFHECIKRGIDLAVNSVESLVSISAAAKKLGKKARVHIKIDTGLGRNGMMPSELDHVIFEIFKNANHVDVVGVMSHFAYADEPENPTIASQVEIFCATVDKLTNAGFNLEVKHLSNSAATLGLPDTYFNLVRPGIAIYGVSPGANVVIPDSLQLEPVMTLKSTIVLIKEVPPNTGVSYAHQYHTTDYTRLGLVPVGYADGLPRSASNSGPVYVGDRTLKVAGRICMDQFVLDLGNLDVSRGEEVIIFGNPAKGEPGVEEWAVAAGTIGYEIVTRIGPRVAREYVNLPF